MAPVYKAGWIAVIELWNISFPFLPPPVSTLTQFADTNDSHFVELLLFFFLLLSVPFRISKQILVYWGGLGCLSVHIAVHRWILGLGLLVWASVFRRLGLVKWLHSYLHSLTSKLSGRLNVTKSWASRVGAAVKAARQLTLTKHTTC